MRTRDDLPYVPPGELRFSEWDELARQHLTATPVHEPDYHYFARLGPDDLFADIGANIGNSIHSLSLVNPALRIVAFEPNPGLWPLLERVIAAVPNAVDLRRVGLSNRQGDFDFFIPVVGAVHIVGEASVDLDHFDEPVVSSRLRSYSADGTFSLVRTSVALTPFDAFDLAPTHVKIDVEGHEIAVLDGMQETITRRRPVFMIEDDHTKRLEEFFAPLGYSARLYAPDTGRLVPKTWDALNVFFVPDEKFVQA